MGEGGLAEWVIGGFSAMGAIFGLLFKWQRSDHNALADAHNAFVQKVGGEMLTRNEFREALRDLKTDLKVQQGRAH